MFNALHASNVKISSSLERADCTGRVGRLLRISKYPKGQKLDPFWFLDLKFHKEQNKIIFAQLSTINTRNIFIFESFF